MPRLKNETTIQPCVDTPHLRGNTPRPSRLQSLILLLTACVLLAAGCSSSGSESANTEATSPNAAAENSSAENSTSNTTAAIATTSTPVEATSPDGPCVFDPAQDVDTAPIDFVAEAIACDREGFRTIMLPPVVELATSTVTDEYGLLEGPASRFEACAERTLEELTDADLIDLSTRVATAYDYGRLISRQVLDHCLSSIGTLNDLTDEEILDAVIEETRHETDWELTGPVLWNANWTSMARTDQVAIFVFLEKTSRLALRTSISFEPDVDHSAAAVALEAFLRSLGVGVTPTLIDDVLSGTSIPTSETIRFCALTKGEVPALMASPLAISCPES